MALEKTYVELAVQIDAGIKVNGNKEIVPPIHNAIEKAIANSSLNKKDGGELQNLTNYSIEFVLSDRKQLVYVGYVDDLVADIYDTIITYIDDNFHKKSEDLFLDDKAIIMKSFGDEGHYFKYRPDDSGNLVLIEDLGTSYP